MERRELDEDLRVLVSPALERRGFLAVFTERTGGSSPPPYDSLNLAFHTGDDAARVRRNRRGIAEALGIPPFVSVRQVHGNDVLDLGGVPTQEETREETREGDALTTTSAGAPLSVLVADCVPVALGSDAEERLTLAHVGWRGLAAGILEAALATFRERGSVAAAIGPCVGPCHYEVGEEVVGAVNGAARGLAAVERSGPRPRLDLGLTVERVLRASGVGEIEREPLCTACEGARFFSHRRDGTTGRQALIAMRM